MLLQSLLYKRVKANEIRNKLSNELMMYHMQIDPVNVTRCIESIIPQPFEIAPDFDKYTFMPRSVAYESTPMVCIRPISKCRTFMSYVC